MFHPSSPLPRPFIKASIKQIVIPMKPTSITPAERKGKDLIGLAQTGSGKTGAFVIPIPQSLIEYPQQAFYAYVLSPTRELAIQIAEQFQDPVNGIKCIVYSATSQPIPSLLGISNSGQTETAPPSLLSPGQFLLSGQTAISSALSSQIAHKDVEVVQVPRQKSSQLPVPAATKAQTPILSLSQQSRPVYKSSRPTMKFNEEFDLMAMNEKFNKDEVWGYIGKCNKSNSKEKEGDENASEGDRFEEVNAEFPKLDFKPVYSKDDFVDTLSSNATDNQSNNGRTKFSEQMKLDGERREVVWFCS